MIGRWGNGETGEWNVVEIGKKMPKIIRIEGEDDDDDSNR